DARTTARRRNEAAAIRSLLLSNSRPAGQSAASHSAESSSKRARFDPPSATSAAVSSSTASPSWEAGISLVGRSGGGGNVAMNSTQVEQSVVSATAESSTAAVSVDLAAVKREGAVSAARFRSSEASDAASSDCSATSAATGQQIRTAAAAPCQKCQSSLTSRWTSLLARAQQQPKDDGQKQPGASSSNVAAVSDAQEANLSDGEIDIKPIVIDDD
uniref:PH domain-containing protein n=1 Tax=Macrostomum lignano TaxID=282301 RepID=A0A1I8FI76_9PLAT